MRDIMKAIEDCNPIRYASYRTAAKMHILHRGLYSELIFIVCSMFMYHRASNDMKSHKILDDLKKSLKFMDKSENFLFLTRNLEISRNFFN